MSTVAPPKRPEFNDEGVRLDTFSKWPEDHCKTPNEMAEAGFRHTGPSDNVHCFYCGGGLRRWEPEDEPWVEHARWWPKCGFVLLNKGTEFVESVQYYKSIGEKNISLEMVEQEMLHRKSLRNQRIGSAKFSVSHSQEMTHLHPRL